MESFNIGDAELESFTRTPRRKRVTRKRSPTGNFVSAENYAASWATLRRSDATPLGTYKPETTKADIRLARRRDRTGGGR